MHLAGFGVLRSLEQRKHCAHNWPLLAGSVSSPVLPVSGRCYLADRRASAFGSGLPKAAPGQLLPLPRLERETFEGPLHFETCRRGNSTYSAEADVGLMSRLGPNCASYLPLSL